MINNSSPEFPPLKIILEDEEFFLYAYGNKNGGQLESNCFNDLSSPHLSLLFATSIGSSLLLRSAEINSVGKGRDLIECLNLLSKKNRMRLSVSDLSPAEEFWENISATHSIFSKLRAEENKEVVYFNFPLSPLFIPAVEEVRLPKTLKSLRSLSILLNAEAWKRYCTWIEDEVKATLRSFKIEATDEFRLEAELQDLVHEIESKFSQELLEKIQNYTLNANITEEKLLVEARIELLRHIQTMLDKLSQCILNIEVVHASHPELDKLTINLSLLKEILSIQLDNESFQLQTDPRLFLLLELFHGLNGIVNCTTSPSGLRQNNFAFSLRLAASQIKRFYPFSDVIETIIQWNQNIDKINLKILHQEKLDQKSEIVAKLRELIYQNFVQIAQPLSKFSSQEELKGLKPNPLFLNFFPAEIQLLSEDEEWKIYPLVAYDANGKPQGYSQKGVEWLKNL